MCGIFGIVNNPVIEHKRFFKSLGLLQHRGPDSMDARFWDRAAFGFNRLSIQDLSPSGNQPMTIPESGLTIIFNGEIYNYRILREQLTKQGARFFSTSDTEVVLHAVRHWGWEKSLEKLEGMFGMALYDEPAGVLLCARDRFGQKPFFYMNHPQHGFVFASELKSILSYVESPSIDLRASMNPIFTTGLSPRGKTCFKDVRQLEPGMFLRFKLATGQFEKFRFFQIKDLVSEDLYREMSGYSDEKMLEVYEKAFDESIQRHLLSDAPLACLFSAGVDSALIAAMSARHTPIQLYHFESEQHDFKRIYGKFAHQYSLPLKVTKGKDEDYIFDLPRLIWHYETINKPEGTVLGKLCSEARDDGFKVLLTGDSSDELFGGYSTVTDFATLAHMHNSPISRFLSKGLDWMFPVNLRHYSKITPLSTIYNHMPSMPHLNEVPLNYFYHEGKRLEEWQACLETYDFLNDTSEKWVSAFLLDEINYRLERFMIRADRFGMMNSVELRLPFLYTPLARLVVNTPLSWRVRPKLFWRGYETKPLVKQLARKVGISKSLVFRKKMGTPFNQDHNVQRILRHWNLDNLASLLEMPVERIRRVALESFEPGLTRIQWSFLSMEILIRLFVHGESHENIAGQFRAICTKATR